MCAFRTCPTGHASTASGILSIASDGYIRLIPTDQNWQPTLEAAASAVAYIARLFSGPDDAVEEVSHEFYDRVTLIDAGENTNLLVPAAHGTAVRRGSPVPTPPVVAGA
jgi:hypothetical protein